MPWNSHTTRERTFEDVATEIPQVGAGGSLFGPAGFLCTKAMTLSFYNTYHILMSQGSQQKEIFFS